MKTILIEMYAALLLNLYNDDKITFGEMVKELQKFKNQLNNVEEI